MSAWYWRVVVLKTVFVLFYYVSYLHADDAVNKLPFCNPHTLNQASALDDLVIVSTLDGKLTAFSTENGIKVWDFETQPLLSSNLHHVELTSGGKWMRLVPSLRGTLYSLTGDTVEPLPFDTDQLLSASFKYSDDLVIAGARESKWIGLDAQTGSVQYECGSDGCAGEQQASTGSLLVLRRHSSTVRALEPRTGSEKWNFSVAEHQLALSQSSCAGASKPSNSVAIAIDVALPEGIVAVTKPGERLPLWQQQLESPVADMWRLHGGSLQHIDVLFEATRSLVDNDLQTTPPSLYIGVHDRMVYVQEGILYSHKIDNPAPVKLPWKLMNSRPLLADDGETAVSLQEADSNALSLITLYGNGFTGNHGFFLYHQDTCDQAIQTTEDTTDYTETNNSEEIHHHVHVHVYSLWFWWKEVLLIAISSALLMNLMIWPRFFAPKFRAVTPLPTVNQECVVVERHYDRPSEYSGRYDNDFTLIRCLGKGGFGVVFEAKNNIDHCSYAVKRITLPRKESKRERVMREVRALAQLEHEHIVRYYNAWVEEPPPAWQLQRDKLWLRELEDASSLPVDDYTATSRPSDVPCKSILDNRDVLNLNQNIDDCIDALDFDKRLGEFSKRNRSLSCNDSFSIVFDENASKDQSKTQNQTTTETPNTLSKDLSKAFTKNFASGDDSFIVFANTEDGKLSEARKCTESEKEKRNESIDKRLEKVKECDTFSQESIKKKKKGHTRHWSLDMCVSEPAPASMYLYIQMQLCLRDSLHDWLRQNNTWEARKDRVKTLFSQIVSAVEYVHLAGLIHRDLKPNNIFFARDGKVKVGDFGLVTAMNETSQDGDAPTHESGHVRHTDRVGTRLYMSPEQSTGRYNYKVDIYSLGIILFELLQPFGTESERVACLMKLRGGCMSDRFREKYPDESEVLKMMLSENPMERPTASGVKARAPLYEQTDHKWHFTLPNHSN